MSKPEIVIIKPNPNSTFKKELDLIPQPSAAASVVYQAVGTIFARGELVTEIIKVKKKKKCKEKGKEQEVTRTCIKLLTLDGTEYTGLIDTKRSRKLYQWLIIHNSIDNLKSFYNWLVYPRTNKEGNVLLTIIGVDQNSTEPINLFKVTGVLVKQEGQLSRFMIYRNKPVKHPHKLEKSFVLTIESNLNHNPYEVWQLNCELQKGRLITKSGTLIKTLAEEKLVVNKPRKKFNKAKVIKTKADGDNDNKKEELFITPPKPKKKTQVK